eukprot:SAG31_NODE_8976_length_1354_cov_1.320319_1_plen_81_part_00
MAAETLTRVHYVYQFMHAEQVVVALLATGADPEAKTDAMATPLHFAADCHAVEALIRAGAKINARQADLRSEMPHAFIAM